MIEFFVVDRSVDEIWRSSKWIGDIDCNGVDGLDLDARLVRGLWVAQDGRRRSTARGMVVVGGGPRRSAMNGEGGEETKANVGFILFQKYGLYCSFT